MVAQFRTLMENSWLALLEVVVLQQIWIFYGREPYSKLVWILIEEEIQRIHPYALVINKIKNFLVILKLYLLIITWGKAVVVPID